MLTKGGVGEVQWEKGKKKVEVSNHAGGGVGGGRNVADKVLHRRKVLASEKGKKRCFSVAEGRSPALWVPDSQGNPKGVRHPPRAGVCPLAQRAEQGEQAVVDITQGRRKRGIKVSPEEKGGKGIYCWKNWLFLAWGRKKEAEPASTRKKGQNMELEKKKGGTPWGHGAKGPESTT